MRKNRQNVQKLDALVTKLQRVYPEVYYRVKQTAKTLKLSGFGMRFEWRQVETSAQPDEETTDAGR